MRRAWFPLLPLALSLCGCGYVGDPLPPALNIPVPVQDLRGLQRGDKVIIAFTPSLMTTDKLELKRLSSIDLRAGENKPGGFDMNRWLETAERLPLEETGERSVQVSLPAAKWAGKEMIFAVRGIGPTGRGAQWSNLLLLNVVPPPAAPVELAVVGAPSGAYLQWKGDGSQWRIWRLVEGDKEPAVLGIAGERSWLDQTAEYGKTYTYMVQQLVGSGATPGESEMSPSVSYHRVDTFPPAVPAGFVAIAGLKSIELNWDRNTEPDFKAYQLYRAVGDEPLKKLGAPVEKTSYSDADVESGKKYRYAVSSVDESGNESQPCAAVEIVAP